MQERLYCSMQATLQTVAEIRMGYSFRGRLEADTHGEVAVIQMKDVDDADLVHGERLMRLRLPDVKEHHLVRMGDLLFRSRGITNSAAMVTADLGKAVLAAPLLLIRPHQTVEPAYLQWFINHPATQASLATRATGTAVKMIGANTIATLAVTLPPLETQRLIAATAQLAAQESDLLDRLKVCRRALVDNQLMLSALQNRQASARIAKGHS
jgi:hypothetical protein